MPKSRSKRSSYIPPKPAKPKPSPRWVPWLGLGLIALGIILILANYIITAFPLGNWNLIIGFVLMAAGLAVLSRWR